MDPSVTAPTLRPRDVVLLPADNARLARLCGPVDAHLREIEQRLGVEVRNRGNRFQLVGEDEACDMAETVLRELHKRATSAGVEPGRVDDAMDSDGPKAELIALLLDAA